jgi:hypothetical protein
MKVVLILIWVVCLFGGIWMLKMGSPPPTKRRKKKYRYSRGERILLTLGWVVTIIGGVGLTLSFAILGGQ